MRRSSGVTDLEQSAESAGALHYGTASDVTMIHLSVFAGGVKSVRVASEPYFRVTGGAIWTRPEERLLLQIRDASWEFGHILWKGMRFIGRCRLIFGVPRDVEGVSTEFDGLMVENKTLYTKDLPLATYDAAYDTWWSLTSEVRCHAFRIESAEIVQAQIGGTREFASGFPSRAFI
jgi:hypothetical protein